MAHSDLPHPCRLYVISPPHFELDVFTEQLREAFAGGDIGAFQLRMKDASDAEIYEAAHALLPICRDHDAAFIMNDRPDIAAELGCDGVHLGQDDLANWPIAKVRSLLGQDAVIGVSCHDSSHMAMEASEHGADYVAFGAFHPTTSKDAEKLAKYGTPTVEMLRWWYTYTVIPCVAIGGMKPENCAPMVEHGADFIAAIQSVWNHPKGPRIAVQAFNREIRQALKARPQPNLAA